MFNSTATDLIRLGAKLTPTAAASFQATIDQYKSFTMQQLQQEMSAVRLPAMKGLTKAELAARLSIWTLWCNLPTPVLLEECGQPNPCIDSEDDADTQRDIALATLVLRKWYCKTYTTSTGWNLDLIEEPHQVLECLHAWEHIQSMSPNAVREYYTSLGFVDPDASNEVILSKLRDVTQWNHWPGRELHDECVKRHLLEAGGARVDRDRMLQMLYCDLCPLLYVAPVEDFESLEVAKATAEQTAALHRLSLEELHKKAQEWEMFLHEPSSREECLNQLGFVPKIVNSTLPALEDVCLEWKVKLERVQDLPKGQPAKLAKLRDLLFFGLSGVPVARFRSIEAACNLASTMFELQTTSEEGVAEQAREWRLMTNPTFDKAHYIGQLYYARLWWELPTEELRQECREYEVSVQDMGIKPDADENDRRGIYLDWLLWSLTWEDFEQAGLPVHEVYTQSGAWSIIEEFQDIQKSPLSELQQRYADMGFRAEGLPKAELQERLKQVAVWLVMPLPVLRRLCREKGADVKGHEDDASWMAWALAEVMFVQTPPLRTPQRGGRMGFAATPMQARAAAFHARGQPRARANQQPPPQSAAREQPRRCVPPRANPPPRANRTPTATLEQHFALLGLSSNATWRDVRLAYLRMARITHPDKQQHAPVTDAPRFVEVGRAYSAIKDHFDHQTQRP
mmetsp:Transcript_45428/g.83084  ORF Transcript_45428/g.83084 Transcript_45428/m.83084 type:complete len:682 (+) Transcript_45428:89-2134(+)